MERDRAGDVAQMRPECKRTTTAKLNDYIIVRLISHPDIDLNDRYPEIRISIHNTITDVTMLSRVDGLCIFSFLTAVVIAYEFQDWTVDNSCVCVSWVCRIVTTLSGKVGFQIQYQLTFCLWVMTFDPVVADKLSRSVLLFLISTTALATFAFSYSRPRSLDVLVSDIHTYIHTYILIYMAPKS